MFMYIESVEARCKYLTFGKLKLFLFYVIGSKETDVSCNG